MTLLRLLQAKLALCKQSYTCTTRRTRERIPSPASARARSWRRSIAFVCSCRSVFSASTPDTGSEFINHQLFAYCQEHGIVFTRSRPFHKNDNCHVEQKNWTLARRLIGYDRLDTPAQQAWLDAFSTDLLRPFANCFQPVMKLIAKEPAEQRTRRVDDTPATPLRRLLDGHADHIDFSRLTALTDLYSSTSPLTLKRSIDRALAALPATLGGRRSA